MCHPNYEGNCFTNANERNEVNRSRTALHVAARFGVAECIEPLINDGADIESKARGNHTPLALAAWRVHCATVKKLIDHGASQMFNLSETRNTNYANSIKNCLDKGN